MVMIFYYPPVTMIGGYFLVMQNSKTRILVEGAMMMALATILAEIKFFDLPQGGSITLEMVPLVIMGYRNGLKWGCFTALVHGLLQMILGFNNVLYCPTLLTQIGCILLDYVLAFGCLGLAPLFAGLVKENKYVGYGLGAAIVGFLRFVCSFLSGLLIWDSYAPEGVPVWIYSLGYNGSYMLPDTIIVVILVVLLYKIQPKIVEK